jgi:benzodiazapine receptor
MISVLQIIMSIHSTQTQIIGLVGWLLLCFAASAVGAMASFQAQSIYGQLVQPDWAPPAWLFGPVWTVLYVMMAISAWLVWRIDGFRGNSKALSLFLIQLLFNALWSWLFFAWQQGLWSFINIVLLWTLIVMTVLSFWRTHKLAGALLLPYLLWVSFATLLNLAVWQLNPEILG